MDIRLHRFGRHGGDHQRQGGTVDRFRYFLQAEQQLEGSGIDLYKEMLPETPSILDFLRENLTANSVVGIDGKVFSTTQAIALQEDLAKNDITVKSIADPMNEIWTDRPPMPEAPAFIHEMKYAGKSCRTNWLLSAGR